MASIDKIYGTLEQSAELERFLTDNKPEFLKYLYTWEDEWLTDGNEHPISLFPESTDAWLFLNCPIGWVIEQITEQYKPYIPQLDYPAPEEG